MSAKICVVPMSTIWANNCNLSPRTYLGLSDNDITIRCARVLARIDADKKTLANMDQQVRDEAAFAATVQISICRLRGSPRCDHSSLRIFLRILLEMEES